MPEQNQHSELRESLAVSIQDVLLIDSPEGDSPRNIAANLREVLGGLDGLIEQLETVELRFDALRYLAVEVTKKPFGQINQRAFYSLREAVSSPASNPEASEGVGVRPQGPSTDGNPSVGTAPSEASDPAKERQS